MRRRATGDGRRATDDGRRATDDGRRALGCEIARLPKPSSTPYRLPPVARRLSPILLALALVALSRLPWIGRLPLLPDEAYYWDWSRRLALGYFDHPFVAALVIRATTTIGGVTPAAVRAGMVLFGLGTVVLAYRLATLLGGRLAGWFALIAAAACPLYALLSLYAAPDGPMLFLWAATVYATTRAIMTHKGHYWYVAGFMLGLALLSKYVAILLAPSILLFVLLFQRGWLRRREPYLGSLIALLVFSPNLWWNARHGWVTISYQLGHGACQGAGSLIDRLGATVIYALTQIGIVGPLLAIFLGAGTIAAVVIGLRERPHPRPSPPPPLPDAGEGGHPPYKVMKGADHGAIGAIGGNGSRYNTIGRLPSPASGRARWTVDPAARDRRSSQPRGGGEGRADSALLLLACCTVVTSLFFLAVHGLAHWAAPAYFSAIVCAGVVAARTWRRARGQWRAWLAGLGAVAALATAAESGYLLYAVSNDIPLPGVLNAAIGPTLVDPAAGWRATARVADATLARLTPSERRATAVLADSYGTAAELGFYMAGHPHVYSASNQYSLWGLPSVGRGSLVLVANAGSLASSDLPLRRGARRAATVTTYTQGRLVRRLEITLLYPSAATTTTTLGNFLAYAWQAAATGCEGGSGQ